jgi:hypothetical protein
MRIPGKWGRNAIVVVSMLLAVPCLAEPGEFGVNVYGLSHHFERDRAKALGLDNEFNPGLGVRYRAPLSERTDWFVDAGVYRDSGRNTTLVAGPGVLWKVAGGIRLGGALAFFDSKSYNGGHAFISPIPIAAYEWRAATLNVAYFPKISNFNDINTLGFWVTVWPKGL